MKRGGIVIFTALFLINFVSANVIDDFLDSVGEKNVLFLTVFFIFFVLIQFAIMRTKLRESPQSANFVALAVTFLSTYYLYISKFDFTGIFYRIGLDLDVIYPFIPFVLLAGFAYLIYKFGFKKLLLVLGGFLIFLSFTDYVYARLTVGIVGGLFVLLAWWIRRLQTRQVTTEVERNEKGQKTTKKTVTH